MAYRSWLKDVRRIEDLGEHCHNLEWTEANETRMEEKEAKWLARLRRDDVPVAPEYKSFFGSRMHDSYIQSILRKDDRVEILLHNDWSDEFIKAHYRIQGIEAPVPLTPVTLSAEDVRYSTICRPDREGYLKWQEGFSVVDKMNVDYGVPFSADWFFQQEGRIQWIVEYLNVGPFHHTYLLVDCGRVTAWDGRQAAIEKAFGTELGQAWIDVCQHFATHPWGSVLIEEFLRERRVTA
jgi:hypothetical protein